MSTPAGAFSEPSRSFAPGYSRTNRASDGSLTWNLVTVTIKVSGLTTIIDSMPNLTGGQKSSLKDKLAAARTFFNSGTLNPACGKLYFIAQVNGLTPTKLSPSTATVRPRHGGPAGTEARKPPDVLDGLAFARYVPTSSTTLTVKRAACGGTTSTRRPQRPAIPSGGVDAW